jgi:hypothetical protein
MEKQVKIPMTTQGVFKTAGKHIQEAHKKVFYKEKKIMQEKQFLDVFHLDERSQTLRI